MQSIFNLANECARVSMCVCGHGMRPYVSIHKHWACEIRFIVNGELMHSINKIIIIFSFWWIMCMCSCRRDAWIVWGSIDPKQTLTNANIIIFASTCERAVYTHSEVISQLRNAIKNYTHTKCNPSSDTHFNYMRCDWLQRTERIDQLSALVNF